MNLTYEQYVRHTPANTARRSAVPEQTRVVIYAIGTPGQVSRVSQLKSYLSTPMWMLVDARFNRDGALHPSTRPGLLTAIDHIRRGDAAVLVMDGSVHEAMSDPVWLKAAVECAGGLVHCVSAAPTEHLDSLTASALNGIGSAVLPGQHDALQARTEDAG